jgi:hypothetical protein
METKILERVQHILREDGFIHISKTSSTHAVTISADKGAQRLVLHITDQTELPAKALQNAEIPTVADIQLTASMPGVSTDATGRVLQRAGLGGAVTKSAVSTKSQG